jgi:hypothetical protein
MKPLLVGTVIITCTLVFPVGVLAVAGGPAFTMTASSTSVTTGQDFTVGLVMDAKTYEVTASDITVTFPASGLQALSIEPGGFLTTVLDAGSVSAGGATIILGSGPGGGVTGTGTVATITFRALQAGTFPVVYDGATQSSAAGESGDVTDTMTGVTVTVTGDAVSPEPTEAPSGNGGAGSSGTGGTGSIVTPQVTPMPSPASVTQQASQVETGPGDYAVIAVLISGIVVLMYAGYMSTDHFRRHDAKEVADQSSTEKDRFDFKGKHGA